MNCLADAGYYSASNIATCAQHRGITPYISPGRERHAGGLERFREPPAACAPAQLVQEQMRHRLRTKVGRAIYGQRKSTVEPAIGIIKNAIGFRQFSLARP